MKGFRIAFMLTIHALLLTGCWDQLELEEQAYVVVMGLDKGPSDMVEITFQIANPQVGSTDKGSAPNEPPSDTVSFTTSDILSAKELANSVVTRKISFSHLRTIIVGEELAKSDNFHHILAASVRDPELRTESNLIVTREKAKSFLHNNKPKLETRPHKYYEFMQERWRDTGLVPYSTLNRYFQRLGKDTMYLAIYATSTNVKKTYNTNEDEYIAGQIPHESGDPSEIMGSAVFRSGRMVGLMTGEETRLTLYMRRKALLNSFISSFEDPIDKRHRLSVRLMKQEDTKIEVLPGQISEVRVTVPVRIQLLSVPSMVDYVTNLANREVLLRSLEKQLEEASLRVIRKTKEQYKGEPFLWNLSARKKFLTINSYEDYDWSEQFLRAKVNIHYDLRIESFGKQLLPPRVQEAEGEE